MADSFGIRLKRAFKWHWNLLALGAGVVIGLLSDSPDIILPMVAASELAYIGFLGLNPRFQNVLRGKKALRTADDHMRLHRLVNFLSTTDRHRFETLQKRCKQLTELQYSMDTQGKHAGGREFRSASLDKLLWLFLKLLHHKTGIERFLSQTDRGELGDKLAEAKHEFVRAKDHGRSERLVESLKEKFHTLEQRVANHDQACENFDLVNAEVDKTEQKIVHLCEVGMTQRDPSDLSHQIDGIAESVSMSERALSDMDWRPYVGDDSPPPLISDADTAQPISLLEVE